MLRYTKTALPFALLACIFSFFANEIWRSSKDNRALVVHDPIKHGYIARHDNIFADGWNWTTEDPVSFYTSILALFTGVLVVISAIQIRFLIRADQTARLMAETAQAQTGKMGDSAESAAKQMLITAQQTDIQEKQHALGRLQFFALHRPKIILREAVIGSMLEGEKIKVILHIANVGSTVGKIVHSTVNVRLIGGTQLILSGSSVELSDDLGRITLEAGQSKLISYPKDDAPVYQAERLRLKSYPTVRDREYIQKRDAEIILTGQLLYVDEIGTQRRTAFLGILKPERQRFYPVLDEPDLDYSD
jgi:hypothetical protein